MNENYEKILDDLLNQSGGKEYCLRQIISESDYRKFSEEYKNNFRSTILDKISKLYEQPRREDSYDETKIINIDINASLWNKYIMKLYFYDTVNYRFFEYYIKTEQVENVSLFEDDNRTYSKSFFTKVKGGYTLWEEYEKFSVKQQQDKEVEKKMQTLLLFKEKVTNKMKFISITDFEQLNSVKAPEQYADGKLRYISNDHYYYYIGTLNGYITFEEGVDLLLNEDFAKLFDKKIRKESDD